MNYRKIKFRFADNHNKLEHLAVLIAVVVVASLVLIATASANEPPKAQPKATANSRSYSDSKAKAVSRSYSQSQANSTAQGGNAEGGNAVVGDVAGGSVSFNDRLQAPDLYAPAAYPTSPCIIGKSLGAVVPGFGLNGGKGVTDPECDLRELARGFQANHEWNLAHDVLCYTAAAQHVWPNGCPAYAPKPIVAPGPPREPYVQEQRETEEAFKKKQRK